MKTRRAAAAAEEEVEKEGRPGRDSAVKRTGRRDRDRSCSVSFLRLKIGSVFVDFANFDLLF
jgi:hypothetical protein